MSHLTLFPGVGEVKYCQPTELPKNSKIYPLRIADNLLASIGLTVGYTLVARALFAGEMPADGEVAVLRFGDELLAKLFSATPGGNIQLSDDSGSRLFSPADVALMGIGLYACLHESGRPCQRVVFTPGVCPEPDDTVLTGQVVRWEADARGDLVAVSTNWGELFEGAPGEFTGAAYSRIFHPADKLRVLTAWTEAVRAGKNFFGSYRVITKFGPLPVTTFAYPIRDEKSAIVRWRGYTQFSRRAQASNF